MRKIQQTKILDTLQTLDEAVSGIPQLTANGEFSSAVQVLAGCQELTASILDYLEEIEGEGTKTSALLEDYYKLLYEASLEINNGNTCADQIKFLKESLFNLDITVMDELKPNKIEVAFLPYKAAMWDSLESIWLTAKDDLQCDAYVIPIPYYEKLPDGSLGNLRCDAGLYPDYVPVVDWKTYNIEARHPDIIFFHNPYDDANYVLHVYPDFQSKRLRALTDLLVYVPYFVTMHDVAKNFCVLPGTLYSDIAFVQSEKVRRNYIHYFEELEKGRIDDGAFGNIKYKFLALGSPKFDKVINSKSETFTMPDNWKSLIENPDGTKKKIILYNTTVTGILQGNVPYLEKIRYTLEVFRSREDVVLWWRPHPMNEATFQSMRPQLMREYMQLTEEYKLEGWGIYDDTANLHRAIAMSDAYYGDGASVSALYLCSGKPLIMQNIYIAHIHEEYRDHAIFSNLYGDGSDIWFTESRFNALFKMNKKSWNLEYMGSIPSESTNFSLYRQIIESHSKLFFAPFFASEIAFYDKDKSEFGKIPFRSKINEQCGYSEFVGTVKHGDFIFFIPHRYPAFMCLNTVTNEITLYSDWVEPLNELIDEYEGAYFTYMTSSNENYFMVASCTANAVISFDMVSRVSTVYEVGSSEYRYNGICFDGENYWLSPKDNTPIVKWNPNLGVIKEFNDFPLKITESLNRFLPIIYCGDYVWLLPNLANIAVKIDVRTDEMSIAEEFQPTPSDAVESKNGLQRVYRSAYGFAQSNGRVIYAYSGYTAELIEYNSMTNQLRREPIILSKDIMDQAKSSLFQPYVSSSIISTIDKIGRDFFIYENSFFTLPVLLDLFTHNINPEELSAFQSNQYETFKRENTNLDGTAGKSIYDYCKRLIRLGAGGV